MVRWHSYSVSGPCWPVQSQGLETSIDGSVGSEPERSFLPRLQTLQIQ